DSDIMVTYKVYVRDIIVDGGGGEDIKDIIVDGGGGEDINVKAEATTCKGYRSPVLSQQRRV
nr:hypothetical protein [Tanacetum cinerariifolium]GFA18372.1 hypothetical protein [Tanacetum cinerariifolium]